MFFNITQKQCSKCKEWKKPEEFYKRPNKKNSQNTCRVCERKQQREWRSVPENRERQNEHQRTRYAKSPDKNLAASRRWKANNKERLKEYAQKHLKDLCQATLRWAKKNSVSRAINEQNRKARKKAVGGSITKNEWQEILEKYGHKCLYPGCERTDVTMDHVVPIKLGGKHVKENVQPLCKNHNSSKGTRIIDYR